MPRYVLALLFFFQRIYLAVDFPLFIVEIVHFRVEFLLVAGKPRFQGIKAFVVVFYVIIKSFEFGYAKTVLRAFQVFAVGTFGIKVAFLRVELLAQPVNGLEILDLVGAFVLKELESCFPDFILFLEAVCPFRINSGFSLPGPKPLCLCFTRKPYKAGY